MSESTTYTVPGMSCGHCKEAVSRAVGAVVGVVSVDVDLDSKLVTVTGESLDDSALRADDRRSGLRRRRVSETAAPDRSTFATTT